MRHIWLATWFAIAALSLGRSLFAVEAESASGAKPDDQALEYFEKRIRPILASNCYECHGSDTQEAGLSVTGVGAMLRGGDQGPAVVPGNPDSSLLIQAVRWGDDLQMPPKGKLSREQIATLTEWVKHGAQGPNEGASSGGAAKKFDLAERAKHWCFQPVRAVPVPEIRATAWPRDTIDRFVLAKLEAANLRPADEADPRTLVRRLYFDLVGLPPTPDEVESVVAGELTYEALVERLLASPRFGERWARHWLDLVRYGETRGHEYDMLIPNAYHYRDYVIRALNADVPYSQFVVEHLAGDLLPQPRLNPANGANESILGTAFWWLGEEVHSPVDPRQDETDRVDNKLDVLSKTFLGVTLACARCHDHKFDALPTKDYYALSGFVLGMSYRQAAFETEPHNRKLFDEVRRLEAQHRRQLLAAQYELWRPMLDQADKYFAALDEVRKELRSEGERANRAAILTAAANEHELDEQRLAAWLAAAEAGTLGAVRTAPPSSPGRVVYDPASLGEHDWFADGFVFGDAPRRGGEVRCGSDPARPIDHVYAETAAAVEPTWDVVRTARGVEAEQNRFEYQLTGRTLKTPTFTLEGGKLAYLVRGSAHVYAEVSSHRTNRGPLHAKLFKHTPGDEQLRWVEHDLSDYAGQRVHLEFTPYDSKELKDQQSNELAVVQVIELLEPSAPLPDLKSASQAVEISAESVRRAAKALRDLQATATLDADATTIVNAMLDHPELWSTPSPAAAAKAGSFFKQQAERMAKLRRTTQTAPCAFEGTGIDEHVLVRGQHNAPGELAPRRFLEAIDGPQPPAYRTASGRLELAERIVDPANPLAARVMVNRLWQHLLGRGIVRTVDNFGIMGDAPTHPELLDHLAREFVADGWSIKRLIRRIVLSSTYRQASRSAGGDGSDSPDELDANNDLLHRANIKRLDAEVIRDALLAVSGRLDNKMYGPGVSVYLTPFMEGRGRPKESGPLDGDGRRSVYLRVRRNFLNPMFQAFDYPTPFTTIGRRSASNVPAQALALLNGELVNQSAERWAKRLLAEGAGNADARIEQLYAEAFARQPTDDERRAASQFLAEQATAYDVRDANDPRPWTDLCHVLINVKEFIYIP
ncbi:MAG TPA: PSD1 and planctomycete cytochrome C domain-containing protein [Pirellulales bacterium]|nr:PSD1 and planctomycete cytochrome C domain-containing protein [Pirellulales bacterium]